MYKSSIYGIAAALCLLLLGYRVVAAESNGPRLATGSLPAVQANSAPSPVIPTKALPTKAALSQSAAAAEVPAGPVEELKPAIFYLPDKDGRLQAVFDFSYEDFVELYKLKQQLEQKEQRPRYTLEKLVASGKADGDHAELTIARKSLCTTPAGCGVPLRLDQGLLLQPAEYKGRGEMMVQYLGGSEGYAAWLRGPTDSPHEIDLRLTAPIAAAGAECKLKLYLPRASISEFKLLAAEHPVAAQASDGANLLPPTASADGGSEIAARGAAGDFELSCARPATRACRRRWFSRPSARSSRGWTTAAFRAKPR